MAKAIASQKERGHIPGACSVNYLQVNIAQSIEKKTRPLGEKDAVGRDGLEMVEADAGRDLTLVDGEVAVHQVGRPVEQARLVLKYSGHEPW